MVPNGDDGLLSHASQNLAELKFYILPNGMHFTLQEVYTSKESVGVIALVVASSISLLAVLGLLLAISTSAFNTRRVGAKEHLFVRTHVAAYFICLLFCDLMQTVGSIMSTKWIMNMSVTFGTYCQVQGAIKQAADVGTGIWSFIIALHTFNVLFLQIEMHRFVLYAALVCGWGAIAALVLGGPASLDTTSRGPFFGISGYWCWISAGYPYQRITLDYMIMFMSAFLCFILYTLIFFRLRGNIVLSGHRLRLRLSPRAHSWRGREIQENYSKRVAKRMLLYPIAYTMLILPIAACRFSAWAHHDVPFAVTAFSDTIFLLSGLVNVVLFSTTRRILPPRSVFKFLVSRPKLQDSTAIPPAMIAPPCMDEKGPRYAHRSFEEPAHYKTMITLPQSPMKGTASTELPLSRAISPHSYATSGTAVATEQQVHPAASAVHLPRVDSDESASLTHSEEEYVYVAGALPSSRGRSNGGGFYQLTRSAAASTSESRPQTIGVPSSPDLLGSPDSYTHPEPVPDVHAVLSALRNVADSTPSSPSSAALGTTCSSPFTPTDASPAPADGPSPRERTISGLNIHRRDLESIGPPPAVHWIERRRQDSVSLIRPRAASTASPTGPPGARDTAQS